MVMRKKHLLSAAVLLLSVLLLCSCADITVPGENDNRLTAPSPLSVPEENAILRNPLLSGDPDKYNESEPEDTSPISPVSDETRLSFIAVGDNILHSAVIEDGARHAAEGEEYSFDYIYDPVRDAVSSADIAFVNQETPMGGKNLGYYGYPNFNGPQEAGDALVRAGFDVVCIATNHMADVRSAGLEGTVSYWKKQPVTLIGGFENQEDYETIRVHEKDGVKIAFLAYTYGTNGMTLETSSSYVIPLIKENDIRRQVAAAKEVGDLVFVNMHWGTDSSFTVTDEQKYYAQLLADLGVDVIIGEHPHVLQPMEWLEGKDGHKTLVTYSIGNFVSTMYNDYFMVGGMLSFDIVKGQDGARIESPLLIPTVTFYDVNRANLSVYFLENFTEELASAHGCNAHGVTSLEIMHGYVTKAIPAEFLPKSFQPVS